MVYTENPDGHRAADGPPRIVPRPQRADKIIAHQPDSGIPHRLDLEELLGERLEGWAKVFRGKIERTDQSACWTWPGFINPTSGYGLVKIPVAGGYKTLQVHRVAFALTHRVVIPAGVLVRHSCGRRSCANPAHLYPGNYRGELVSPEWAA